MSQLGETAVVPNPLEKLKSDLEIILKSNYSGITYNEMINIEKIDEVWYPLLESCNLILVNFEYIERSYSFWAFDISLANLNGSDLIKILTTPRCYDYMDLYSAINKLLSYSLAISRKVFKTHSNHFKYF